MADISPAQTSPFALSQAQSLVQMVISAWHRRGYSLLLVGCGEGPALEPFWRAGFETTGIDADPLLLRRAADQLGPRVDLRRGDPALLPFDDGQFDYAAVIDLPDSPACSASFEQRALEACRCAQLGVVFAFFNAASPAGLVSAFSNRRKKPEHPALRWSTLQRKLRENGFAGAATTASTLFGPPTTWKSGGLRRYLNSRVSRTTLGMYLVCRLDFDPAATLTPLLCPTRSKKTVTAAAASPINTATPRSASTSPRPEEQP